jgi:hypothetical protein
MSKGLSVPRKFSAADLAGLEELLEQRVTGGAAGYWTFWSPLPPSPTALLALADKAYFGYIGETVLATAFTGVRFALTVIGAGADVAEVGLYSSPLAPNRSNQTLTKLAAAALPNLPFTGIQYQDVIFGTVNVPIATHLWLGIRTNYAVTQPTFEAVGRDVQAGYAMQALATGPLTGLATVAATLMTAPAYADAQIPRICLF